ncbi:medium chain dehydrogenase/reductase family protein [Natrialba taiwanensis]|uniref:Dehydrogenase n=1 Tax=Natrialba taiwanensis DSM 12281 TaxID=1230458 RepID=M0A4I2_9EURY|nr:medium chain dehydrogenase/reductase family protein [Natrialba taiwanensis]ELY92258.1 dehydrogenase [Natrialba taiwanensis DSM 12281]
MPHTGGPNILQKRKRDLPPAKADEVRVRVEAAGFSFAEVQMLRGRYFNQPRFPFVPGYDLVGTVTDVGPGVSDLAVGKRVAALTETGSWAENVVLPAEKLVPVPDNLDPADTVAVVTNGVTARQMLHRVARVQPGQTVLVHGASGGVGTLLMQLARIARVDVIGTASASKHDLVRSLGATPLDYRTDDVPARVRELEPNGVDAVFDHVGGPGLADSWRLLAPGGTLVSYGVASALEAKGHRLLPFVPLLARLLLWKAIPNGRQATFYYVQRWPQHFEDDLTAVLALLAKGQIDTAIDRRVPLSEASDALRLLDSRRASGKVVLVSEDS